MAISFKDKTRLYLKPWDYNLARVLTHLALLIIERGGRVQKQHSAIVSDRYLAHDITPIEVSHLSYIEFILDNVYYSYSVCDNPLFDFLIVKTPVIDGKYSKNIYAKESSKSWLYDCLFKSNCDQEDIIYASEQVYYELLNTPMSENYLTMAKVQVPNTYNEDYHTEIVPEKPIYRNLNF